SPAYNSTHVWRRTKFVTASTDRMIGCGRPAGGSLKRTSCVMRRGIGGSPHCSLFFPFRFHGSPPTRLFTLFAGLEWDLHFGPTREGSVYVASPGPVHWPAVLEKLVPRALCDRTHLVLERPQRATGPLFGS